MVLLVGDLAQLPPINAPFVFKSVSWEFFMPLFLHTPKRQSEDIDYFETLQEIRFNQITNENWEKLKSKVIAPSDTKSPLETTHIMGYRSMADRINEIAMSYLPIDESYDLSFTSFALDKLDNESWDIKKLHKTQGLTLPDVTVALDSQMFAAGQAYVAISRAKTWDSLTLTALDYDSIKTDEKVIMEYSRLQEKYDRLITSFGV
ncbi:unnamed protein product [Rhizophagus irregularis]|nr:unnamed protein product [Rhizophagus irregularis]